MSGHILELFIRSHSISCGHFAKIFGASFRKPFKVATPFYQLFAKRGFIKQNIIWMVFDPSQIEGVENIDETISESSNYESLNLKKVRVNSVADIKSISILQPVSVVALSELAIIEWNGANSDLVEHYELELYPEHGSIEYSKRNRMNRDLERSRKDYVLHVL